MMKTFKQAFCLFLVFVFAAALFPVAAVEPSYTVSGPYGESSYCENLKNLTLTGDYRTDLVNVALTQVGYHEGADLEKRRPGNRWTLALALGCLALFAVFYPVLSGLPAPGWYEDGVLRWFGGMWPF